MDEDVEEEVSQCIVELGCWCWGGEVGGLGDEENVSIGQGGELR